MTRETNDESFPALAVVGANGFIGRRTLARLSIDARRRARAIVRSLPIHPIENVEYCVIGDNATDAELAKCFRGTSALIYAAGQSIPARFVENPATSIAKEVESLARVCRAMTIASVSRIVFLSSGGTVYGECGRIDHTENTPLAPKSEYGRAKALCEETLRAYAQAASISPLILRASNLYGIGQAAGRGQGVASTFAAALLTNEPIHLWGDGADVRDYLYIDDAVDAIFAAIGYHGSHDTFNIGSGRGTSLLDLLALLERCTHSSGRLVRHPRAMGAVAYNVLDCSLAARELDWRAKTSLPDGLTRMVAWLEKELR